MNFSVFPGRKAVCVFLSLFVCNASFSFNELTFEDARSFALGSVQSLSNELINPSELSFQEKTQFGISVLNRFEISELNTVQAYAKLPNSIVDAGIKLSYFGYEDYYLIRGQTSFSKKINPNFSVGINLNYWNESSLLQEKDKHHISSDLGVYYQLSNALGLTLLTQNILSSSDFNSLYAYLGIHYRAFSNFSVLIETSYNKANDFDFSCGVEYTILEQLFIRGGLNKRDQSPRLGVGYQWRDWQLDAGFSIHSTLGISSIIGINYFLK